MRPNTLRVITGLAVLALLASCSSDPERNEGTNPHSEAGQGGGGTGGAGGFLNPDPNATLDAGPVGGTGSLDTGDPSCVGDTQGAQPIEVDMYVMLDRSGSMLGPTADGTTKWDAVRTALIAFAGDPASDGLGVGLQYFPLGKAGVPDTCANDGECQAADGGFCLNTACAPSALVAFDFTFCLTDADCPIASPGCFPYGICELDSSFACFDISANGCSDVDAGACQPAAGECTSFASCSFEDYATPEVPIAPLPGNEAALVDALMSTNPIGLTPTPAALDGAIARATAQAVANPTRRSIVVLATDGLPTECLPLNVMSDMQAVQAAADIAAAGLASTPSIRTYVIGVFGPDDVSAQENLDVMAQGGGTDRAFIVDSSGDVAMQFVSALNEIRAGTLQCELQIPEAPAGQTLNYDRVNIELTSGADKDTLLYVENEAGCASAELGWFYDVDPASGAAPMTIRICPKSCDQLQALGGEATLDVRLGCATLRPD